MIAKRWFETEGFRGKSNVHTIGPVDADAPAPIFAEWAKTKKVGPSFKLLDTNQIIIAEQSGG